VIAINGTFLERRGNVWGPSHARNRRVSCIRTPPTGESPLRVSAAGSSPPFWRRKNARKDRIRTVVRTSMLALAVACCASACTQEQRARCVIKGNSSSNGERIYHVPGQRYYDKTIINWSKGERWFCTEQEAIGAGWRKAKV
jgi:hypothetical protein